MQQQASRPRCYVTKYSDTAKECGVCSHSESCSRCWEKRVEKEFSEEPYRTIIIALQDKEMSSKEIRELVKKTGRSIAYPYIQRLSKLGVLNVMSIGRTKVYSLARKFEVK